MRQSGRDNMLGFLGGTGEEGRGLSLRLCLAGERVMIGSRDSAKAREIAIDMAANFGLSEISSGNNEDVARNADVIFITVPFVAQKDLLETVKDNLAGKIVVDTVAPVALHGGRFYTMPVDAGSASLEAQSSLPKSEVVAAFQNVSAKELLALPVDVEGDVLMCGGSVEAKRVVEGLVNKIPNLRPIDGGGLENSSYVEGITALLLNINKRYKAHSSIKVIGL